MSEHTREQARTKVAAIRERALADPTFMEQVLADPAGVLREAGVPDEVARQIASSMAEPAGEVAGYRLGEDLLGHTKFLCIPQ